MHKNKMGCGKWNLHFFTDFFSKLNMLKIITSSSSQLDIYFPLFKSKSIIETQVETCKNT